MVQAPKIHARAFRPAEEQCQEHASCPGSAHRVAVVLLLGVPQALADAGLLPASPRGRDSVDRLDLRARSTSQIEAD